METQNILIREEKDTDYRVISDVTKSAFKTMEISNHTEQFIIEALRSAKGCCLVGRPEYYRQFGFKNVEGLVYEGVPQEVFFALSFDGNIPLGNVTFHEGFKVNGPQGAVADS